MLRIVGGKWRGRKLSVPDGRNVRPTSERARESLFNVLQHRLSGFEGLAVADLFAGTGALGFEALSRGAASLRAVEQATLACTIWRSNCPDLTAAQLIQGDARALPRAKSACDLLLMDPPFSQDFLNPALRSALQQGWIGPQTLIVCELDRSDPVPEVSDLTVTDDRRWGRNRFLFMELNAASATG